MQEFTSRDMTLDEVIVFYEQVDGIEDDEERRQARATLGRTDLFYLGVNICKREDLVHPWLYERIREVERDPNGFIDLWARDHYKSTIITFLLTLQDILNDPETTIGIFSHTKEIAKGFLRQLKQEMEGNTDLKYLYEDVLYDDPENQSPKWSESEGLTVKRTLNPKEATVEAWGLIEKMPTGKHFKKRIYDDVVTPEAVTNPEQMKKATDAWRMSDNLGSEGGIERVVGTRYHQFDPYYEMMKSGTLKPRVYPATSDGTDDVRKAVFMTPERLREKRKKQGLFIFHCQMLQNPRADTAVGFQEEWLRHWEPLHYKNMNICIIVDPASGKKREKNKNDYTVYWVLGRGGDDNWYAIDCIRDRLNLTSRAKMLISLHRQYRPAQGRVFYEEVGMQADIEAIQYIQEQENYRFPIVPLSPGGVSKNKRIERLIAPFEAGRIYTPNSIVHLDWEKKAVNVMEVFKQEEFLAYPVLAHDDMLDCLSNIEDEEVLKRVPKPSPKEAGQYALDQLRAAARRQRSRVVC